MHSYPPITLVAALLAVAVLQGVFAQPAAGELAWHAVQAKHVSGKGWTDVAAPFDRLPRRAQALVRPAVWQLSRDSAGLSVDFTTDARSITVKWTLNDAELALPHMAATGVSGVDLYVQLGDVWHYAATARPTKTPTNEVQMVDGLAALGKRCRLYLPLYNGVSEVQIGVPQGAEFSILELTKDVKPIVIYGTSITQGGCASRPGMAYPAILGRRLGMPVINLGFSGNGKCEPEVAKLLAELDPAIFVLDPLPNLFPDQAAERLPPLIDALRTARPQTPVLLVGMPRYADAPLIAERAKRVRDANQIVEDVLRRRIAGGDQQFFVAPGIDFSAEGGELTVDGTHPTDLGFTLMADSLEPHLRRALVTETVH